MAAAVCGSVTDANAQLVVVLSATGQAPRLIAKYRPFVPQVGCVAVTVKVLLRGCEHHVMV
jgi:pyruvate kinase